jgi:carnosine synthase
MWHAEVGLICRSSSLLAPPRALAHQSTRALPRPRAHGAAQAAGSWAERLVEEGIIKKFIALDMEQDAEAVYQETLKVIEGMRDDPTVSYPHGICTFSELSVPLVARLCNTLGLPSSPAQAVDIARNKHDTRAAMKNAGLATVANALIKSTADITEGVKVVGFPAVLKPISGAASLGVKKVYSEEELHTAFAEVSAEMRDTVITSGALVKSKTIDQDLGELMKQDVPVPLIGAKPGAAKREFLFM